MMRLYFRLTSLLPLFALLFLLPLSVNSQDTTVIQTFTWDSIGRSGYFDFPDDSNKSYEKILMVYNMRCYDAAVGNGSVGCKEWDYSCNTFVHVPEKTDSSLAFNYDYDVSQHADDYFAFTTETHYTYYASEQIITEYKKVNSEQSYLVDQGNHSPFNLGNSSGKFQMLFTAEELLDLGLNEGQINGMALDFIDFPGMLKGLRIKMNESMLSELNPDQPFFGSFHEVFYSDMEISGPGLTKFNFHEAFEWDGSSNILVEFSYDEVENPTFSIKCDEGTVSSFNQVSNQQHALEFGGSWGVELDKAIFEPIDEELTIAFWSFGRPQHLPNRNTTILEGYDADNRRTVNVHLPWSNSGVYWDCGNEGTSYDRINKTPNPEEFRGKWNHWAFTKNISTGIMNIYLNGELWHSGDSKTRPINVEKFRLGSGVTHSLGYYGMLDEFSVWNKELSPEIIKGLMHNAIENDHPDYTSLLAYYDFEQRDDHSIMDLSPYENHASFEGGPKWRNIKAENLRYDFESYNIRPVTTFYRGSYDIEQEFIQVLEKVITPENSVIQYGVESSALVALDTFFTWEAIDSKVYNEEGEILDEYYVEPEDFLFFEEIFYFTFGQSKMELLSLVTPYGNGLDLGMEGKTFIFDVSDFYPVLKGNRRLTVEFGSTQEELDIKFLFIEGTPSRNVLDINNIWPFARGWYDPIQKNKIFEPRLISIPGNISQAKIRASITGHGQNGEFVARNHRINLNGDDKTFEFKLWKECAFNPIYPQGGTWIYDRAGWCPGMPTDLYEFDITPHMNPGSEVEVDYEVFGPYMAEANYLVSNQLVYYEAPNFTQDAALEHIVRPNQNNVEFARFNPNCSDPAVIIKNNGTTALTSLEITYGVEGVSEKTYTWNGNLAFLEKEEVILPVDDLSFFGATSGGTFFAEIKKPNGGSDEYSNNNKARTQYVMPDSYEGYERWLLRVRTNSRAAENKYKLLDQDGNVVLNRESLSNNTTYDDEISLAPGCYSFEITDSGNDGLSFWNNPSAGSGWVSIRRIVNENVSFERIKFESDFGGVFSYDFIIDESVDSEDPLAFKRLGLYPNPTSDWITIESEGIDADEMNLYLLSLEGRVLKSERRTWEKGKMESKLYVGDLEPGHYHLKLLNKRGSWVKSFIKL